MTHAHDFQDQECATSLISCTLSGDPNSSYSGSSGSSNTYYCVGTAHVIPVEPEPKSGRLLLFQLVEGVITLFVLRLFFFPSSFLFFRVEPITIVIKLYLG